MKKLTARQIAAMTPEARERYERKLKKITRNRRILTGIIAVIAVAAVFAVLSVTVLFNISEIKVANAGKHYKSEQILDAAGIEVGDNIITTDWNRVKDKVEQKLPYVLSIDIKKSLSGEVVLSVKDDTAAMLFKTSNGYAIADADGKVLEVLYAKPKNSGLMLLTVKNSINAKPGEIITFADDAEQTLYDNICLAIKESGIKNITGIDIHDPKNIYIEYQNRYRLYLGDNQDLTYKLKEAKKVITKEDENDPTQIGEINLSILKKVYVEKLETLEKTTIAQTKAETTTVSDTTTKAENSDADSQDDEGETTAENGDSGDEEGVTEPDAQNDE